MTPKEKSEELVDKYFDEIMSFLSDNMKKNNTKKLLDHIQYNS